MKRRAFFGLLAVPAVITAQPFLPNSSANVLSTKEKEDVLLQFLLECNGVPEHAQIAFRLEVTPICIRCEEEKTEHCLAIQPYYITHEGFKNFCGAALLWAPFGEIENRESFVHFAYESLMNNQNFMVLPAANEYYALLREQVG